MVGQLTEATVVKPQRVLGLDTVRAFAAISVMLAHTLGQQLPNIAERLGVNQSYAELCRYIFTGHPAVMVFFIFYFR